MADKEKENIFPESRLIFEDDTRESGEKERKGSEPLRKYSQKLEFENGYGEETISKKIQNRQSSGLMRSAYMESSSRRENGRVLGGKRKGKGGALAAAVAAAGVLVAVILTFFPAVLAGGGLGGNMISTTYPEEDEVLVGYAEYFDSLLVKYYEDAKNSVMEKDSDEYIFESDGLDYTNYDRYSLLSYIFSSKNGREDPYGAMEKLCAECFTIETRTETEIRYREEERETVRYETGEDGELIPVKTKYTVEIPYEYSVTYLTCMFRDIDSKAKDLLTEEEYALYGIMLMTKGNRPDLFP